MLMEFGLFIFIDACSQNPVQFPTPSVLQSSPFSLFNAGSIFHDYDVICQFHHFAGVGYEDHCEGFGSLGIMAIGVLRMVWVLHRVQEASDAISDEPCGYRIQSAGCFVEDENSRFADESSGNCDALRLAT